jgi:hypothetical protein
VVTRQTLTILGSDGSSGRIHPPRSVFAVNRHESQFDDPHRTFGGGLSRREIMYVCVGGRRIHFAQSNFHCAGYTTSQSQGRPLSIFNLLKHRSSPFRHWGLHLAVNIKHEISEGSGTKLHFPLSFFWQTLTLCHRILAYVYKSA